jgi:DNA-binding Lrp family transcriptional regulator
MDDIDRKLLAGLQNGFPLTARPFAGLGKSLGVPEMEIIGRIRRFKLEGIVRQISPVLDARRLGYRATLVAMKVAPDRLENAARVIRRNPGISHGYERDYDYNVWVTLAVPAGADIEAEMAKPGGEIPAEAIFQLPALKLYKIGAFFGDEGGEAGRAGGNGGGLHPAVRLSEQDRAVINAAQRDLPLESRPFTGMAEAAGLDEEMFLARCRSLLDRGVMRRYGAAVNHRRAGYTANAMACWNIPADKVDEMGRRLAARREVSHCYERETNLQWPYNLFAMIHGHDRETCREIVREASEMSGWRDCLVLFSTRELKKTRIKYVV